MAWNACRSHLEGVVTIVELFSDCERFPLYAFRLSRHVLPAKVRAFVDFVARSVC
jgi:DNA-binding transcriptional LysR family regulator